MILAGDTGGTNTRLALFTEDLKPIGEPVVTKNLGRESFQGIAHEFLNSHLRPGQEEITRACFGVAGPVTGGHVVITNLSWQLSERELAAELKVPKVALINDLVANAEGIERLQSGHVVPLNDGVAVDGGTRAIIAAGTGLGQGTLVWEPGRRGYRAVASEGGHADFSPQDDREIALLQYMRGRFGHVSWESVLSGPGLRNLYDFLITPSQLGPSAALPMVNPTPADISQAGSAGTNPAAKAALDLFVGLYGAEAGNLALKLLATGGVYLGGGIAPRIISLLRTPAFVDRFWKKGPQKIRDVLRTIPIHAINFDLCALYGAANFASRM